MPLIQLLRVSVHPRAIPRYERAVRRLAEKARGDSDTVQWSARVTQGVDGIQFGFLVPTENFAQLAAREQIDAMARRLFGESEGNAVLDELSEGVQSQSFSVLSPREDLSNAPLPFAAPPPLIHHMLIRVRPGGQEALENTIKKLLEAAAKVGDKRQLLTAQTLIGDLGESGIAQPIQDPAQLDSQKTPPELLTEAFGEQEAREILAAGRERMESAVTLLSVHRPDLSNEG